jgi:flagellar biosynthesis protein|tara:strand:+ start:342 stop:632 length:291 start_codon:yes stop_codon:yes gene_type:complete
MADRDGKDKIEAAVALDYDFHPDNPSKDAPRVLAKGKGEVARKIIEVATDHDIPLYEDPDLVEVLYRIDLGEEIPPELYKVIAEVLVFIYTVNKKA